eukprot:TRINITY_DN12108_c0_g1_i5.p1 TRINITY_DN12108_c0_g1~~TRINITY_DN12108_c0_g1_i5.p1  ORF type:complete len:189 (+),score=6.52 TRINITY_DN12108_c0_g1_i5:530-1096(+)
MLATRWEQQASGTAAGTATSNVLRLLLDFGACPIHRNIRQNSALHFAYERHNIALVHLLLSRGGGLSLKHTNTLGKTPRDHIDPSCRPTRLRTRESDAGFCLFRNEHEFRFASRDLRELTSRVALIAPKAASRTPRKIFTGGKLHPHGQEIHRLSSACTLSPALHFGPAESVRSSKRAVRKTRESPEV